MRPKWAFCIALLIAAGPVTAQEGFLTKEELAATLPGVEPHEIHDSILPGMYEIILGAEVAYVSRDGGYLIQGEVYDVRGRRNLTEQRRAEARNSLLAGIDPETMIEFSPAPQDVKHTVTVFTDIDCGFCRQLHREMEQINALGIAVRYLSYPRTGPDTESWSKADKVWCGADRQAAFTEAILADELPEDTCDATPVGSHFDLGRQVGVRGTPTVLNSDGVHLGGYLEPGALLAKLEALAEQD